MQNNNFVFGFRLTCKQNNLRFFSGCFSFLREAVRRALTNPFCILKSVFCIRKIANLRVKWYINRKV